MASPEQDRDTGTALATTFENGGLYSLRASVAAHASELGATPTQVGHLVLIASELMTNAIAYGGGRGELRLWRANSTIYCQVSDSGPGIREPESQGLQAPPASAQGGRGLWVARNFSDEFEITTGSEGTRVTVAMQLKGQ